MSQYSEVFITKIAPIASIRRAESAFRQELDYMLCFVFVKAARWKMKLQALVKGPCVSRSA